MRGKILTRNRGGQKQKIKIRYLVAIVGIIISSVAMRQVVQAESCPDLRVVFARGSGGERWNTDDYLTFKSTIETKLQTTELKYEFIDLDYPAVGIDKFEILAGAYFGAGDAYEFGASVNKGVKNLITLVNDTSCPNTKYVLGGYSQGAMTTSKALGSLDTDKIIYAATFGDPKLYLPEGEGVMPAACRGENLSDYRMYVPDCQAYKGILGAYVPYEPTAYEGKVGTWCNGGDVMCSSHFNIANHVAYVADNLYEDASRVIFDKVCKAFGLENHISSPHDTAILIDSTGSMWGMIEQYKAEALRLAKETLDSGGRVALYDYRDLDDPYEPVEHCNFETCTLEVFQSELDTIDIDGGGDTPESLLSASFHVMKSLKWKRGATKSLVVLTDANFLSPDRDGMSFDEVVTLSKAIDPVNFYIITESEYGDYYGDLAEATGGKVVTNFDELNLLTDYIMERYDSLPRVEESTTPRELPVLTVEKIDFDKSEAVIHFDTTGLQTLVILNDAILGITNENTVVISGLNATMDNVVKLVPLGDDVRGEMVEVRLDKIAGFDNKSGDIDFDNNLLVPKAPNTGRAR